jgi:hypothetical protein
LDGRSYLLDLYFLTSLGPGASPLVEFFRGTVPMTDNSRHTGVAIEGALSFRRVACAHHREISQEPQIHDWGSHRDHCLDVLAYTKDRTQQLCCGAWHKLFGKRPRWEIWTWPCRPTASMAARETDCCQRLLNSN